MRAQLVTHTKPHGSMSARFFVLARLQVSLSADRTQTTNYCHEGLARERWVQGKERPYYIENKRLKYES